MYVIRVYDHYQMSYVHTREQGPGDRGRYTGLLGYWVFGLLGFWVFGLLIYLGHTFYSFLHFNSRMMYTFILISIIA